MDYRGAQGRISHGCSGPSLYRWFKGAYSICGARSLLCDCFRHLSSTQEFPLWHILGIPDKTASTSKRVARGSLAWAKLQIPESSGDDRSRIAECRKRIRSLAPGPRQTGAAQTGQLLFEGKYLPKYHWEQVAYARLLEVRLSRVRMSIPPGNEMCKFPVQGILARFPGWTADSDLATFDPYKVGPIIPTYAGRVLHCVNFHSPCTVQDLAVSFVPCSPVTSIDTSEVSVQPGTASSNADHEGKAAPRGDQVGPQSVDPHSDLSGWCNTP